MAVSTILTFLTPYSAIKKVMGKENLPGGLRCMGHSRLPWGTKRKGPRRPILSPSFTGQLLHLVGDISNLVSLYLAKRNFLRLLWSTTIIWAAANWWAGQGAIFGFYRTCFPADAPFQSGKRVLVGETPPPPARTGDPNSLLENLP